MNGEKSLLEATSALGNLETILGGSIEQIQASISTLIENENSLKGLQENTQLTGEDCKKVTSIIKALIDIILIQKKSNLDTVQGLEVEKEKALKVNEELIRKNECLQKDQLTGLPNRYKFDTDFNALVEKNGIFSLGILDIDDFKKINDTYGHLAGDKVLSFFASFLTEHLSKLGYTIYRFGGEEFLILSNDTKENTQIELSKVLMDIRKTSLFSKSKPDIKIRFTFSGGVTQFSEGKTFQDLFEKADDLLYVVKKSGKNQVLAAEIIKREEIK